MRRLVLALLLALAPPAALAQPAAPDAGAAAPDAVPLDVKTELEPGRVQLGVPLVVRVTLQHRKDERYELVGLPREGPFEVLGQTRQRQDGPDRATTTFEVRLAAFELGQLETPDLAFDVATPQGPRRFVARGATLEVLPTLPENAEQAGVVMADLKPPVEVPVRSWRVLWWALGALGAALAAWGGWRLWQRLRARVRPAAPPAPLDVRTLSALDALAQERLPEQGRAREFAFRLSELARGYLGERYAFDALECTRPELLAHLTPQRPPGLDLAGLERLTDALDFMKYARAEASPSACAEALAFVRAMVERTSLPPPPPPPSPGTSDDAPGPRAP